MNSSRSRRDVTSETSIFDTIKTKMIPHCHSERNEESLIASEPDVREIGQRSFAPPNMIYAERPCATTSRSSDSAIFS